MHAIDTPDERRNIARTAGLLYLVNIVTGIFSFMYVPSRISGHGDVAVTISHIASSQLLFRCGVLAGIACYTVFLLLPLVLYRLLGAVNRSAATLMVLFAIVSVPIFFAVTLYKLDILSLLGHAGHVRALTSDQLNERVTRLLDAYANGWIMLELFSGLWLLPFGYLVFKCGFLPKALGVLLTIGGISYAVDFIACMLFPAYTTLPVADFTTAPAAVAEILTCLWLLIVGARASAPAAAMQSA